MAKIIPGNLIRKYKGCPRYPWAEWLDGQQRELIRGEDFSCSPLGFRKALYTAANRMKKRVKSQIVDKNTIRIQARA